MPTVTSKDGTSIAYETTGSGPAVILVDGALCYRDFGPMRPLAELLAPHFTTYAYDRRGRGASGDTLPFAPEREVEDIDALIAAAGGSACVFGTSSGAVLALEAASQLADKVTKLAMYEPPLSVNAQGVERFKVYRTHIGELLAAGKRGDTAEAFMRLVGQPDEAIAGMRQAPMWPMFEAVAPTLAYDAGVMGDSSIPTQTAARVATPALVMAGGASPEFMQQAAREVAEAMPHARYDTLDGQTHAVDVAVLAPVLISFFTNR